MAVPSIPNSDIYKLNNNHSILSMSYRELKLGQLNSYA